MSKHTETATYERQAMQDSGLSAEGCHPDPCFLSLVGGRVRSARGRKGVSRRELSEISGVSPRYLAQLESGKGNISIGLLLKIANALNVDMENLVSRDNPLNSEFSRLRFLFSRASSELQNKVMGILQSDILAAQRARRIALIGLRGAGKSTLGRLAAKKLGVGFQDLNELIETLSGMPVNEVFSLYGEPGYRRLERQSLETVATTHDSLILEVAGGIVSEPETFNYLLHKFHTIWLQAEPDDHMARVRGQGDERPMSGNPDAMADLLNILNSRKALYARAQAHVTTSNATPEESLQAVLKSISSQGFLQ